MRDVSQATTPPAACDTLHDEQLRPCVEGAGVAAAASAASAARCRQPVAAGGSGGDIGSVDDMHR
jgi:hypothetical protein